MTEEYVFGNAHCGNEIEFLVNNADSVRYRGCRIKNDRIAVDLYLPGVWFHRSGQNAHER